MSYQPLHHKYRPQTFAQLVGQEAIATTLTQALEQQRIPPAYLFTGARGTGKTSSARIMAKSLNCLNSPVPTASPCGTCEVCRSIVNGSALDVIEIDAASNTGVDNIRELIERAQFAPVQCRYKVYAIDECHMLSSAAFNALLKTLEEPPDRVVFILATTDPQRVLPTIISRCQRFDFRRIPLAPMVEHLQMIARQEAIAIADEAITLVAQISQGGLRDAESLLDQLSLSAAPVTAETVWDLVGAVPERDLLALLYAIAANDAEAVLDHTRRLMDRGREPLIVLQNLASFYRDLLIAKTAPQRHDLVALTPPTWQALSEFAQGWDITVILQGQEKLRSSEGQLKHTTQPRLWLEVTLLGLLPAAIAPSNAPIAVPPAKATPVPPVAPSPPAPIAAAEPTTAPEVAAPTTQESKPEALPAAPEIFLEPTAPLPTANQTPTPQFDLAKIWQQVLASMEPPGTQALLKQHGTLQGFDGEAVQIGIRAPKLHQMVKDRLPNVEAAFVKVFKKPVRVNLQVMGEAIATPIPPETPTRPELPAPPSALPTPPKLESRPPEVGPPKAEPVAPAPIAPEPLPPDPIAPLPEPEDFSLTEPTWQAEDEGIRAAKSLAHAFNGEIVGLDDIADAAIAPLEAGLIEAIEATPEPEDPEEDEGEDF
jgi:DNA polymerase III subunit gamma/tau